MFCSFVNMAQRARGNYERKKKNIGLFIKVIWFPAPQSHETFFVYFVALNLKMCEIL